MAFNFFPQEDNFYCNYDFEWPWQGGVTFFVTFQDN